MSLINLLGLSSSVRNVKVKLTLNQAVEAHNVMKRRGSHIL
jgi:hypothetical protein